MTHSVTIFGEEPLPKWMTFGGPGGGGEFAKASAHFETQISPAMARVVDDMAATPAARSQKWSELALRNFQKDPGAFAGRLAHNAIDYWRPWLNPQTYPWFIVVGTGLLTVSIYVLAWIGWCTLYKQDRWLALWCLGAALAFWLLQVPFQVVGRFRIPIADPFLIIFAASAIRTTTFRFSWASKN